VAVSGVIGMRLRIQVKRMMGNAKMKQLSHGGADLLHPWITEFKHFFALYTNEVIVLFVSVGLFKMTGVFAKLMLFYQAGINQ
jgi:hypothetical protein